RFPHRRFFVLSSRIFHSPYTLPSSVSCNSFTCHSYENTGGVGVFFPIWNSSHRLSISSLHDSPFPCFLPSHFLASLLRYFLISFFSHPIRHGRLYAIEKEQAAKKDKRDRERRSQQQQPGSLPSARNRPPESVDHPRHRVQSVQPSP